MKAKEFYNKRAFKHQLRRAIKHDKQYFEDTIIELMEMYAQEQVKNLTIPVVSQQRELLLSAICQFTKRNTQKEIQEVEKWIESDFRK
jgi:hypothetical protein